MHTIEAFESYPATSNITLVLPPHQFQFWKQLCKDHNFTIEVNLVEGGITRFESVKNGLCSLGYNGIVAIHDGVRPLVTKKVIENCVEMAKEAGAAIPVIALKDSLRKVKGSENEHVSRSEFRAVQTPQCFDLAKLIQAYKQPFRSNFTDDASVWEAHGGKVRLVEGDAENLKITYPLDLQLAELIMNNRGQANT